MGATVRVTEVADTDEVSVELGFMGAAMLVPEPPPLCIVAGCATDVIPGVDISSEELTIGAGIDAPGAGADAADDTVADCAGAL